MLRQLTTTTVALLSAAAFAQAPEGGAMPQTSATGWSPACGPLKTHWAADVSPQNALPEYPRPQMVRARWVNLNGLWQFDIARAGETPPHGRALSRQILVPFPVESALSGIMQQAERVWYRRTFTAPPGARLLLHFEAVDWETTVYVNGREVGTHRGGYDPFSFDITEALQPSGEQELLVGVFDPTDEGDQPRGKQVRHPEGIWYTPTTGIWQTVWLEPVPHTSIADLQITPDVPQKQVQIKTRLSGPGEGVTVHAVLLDTGKTVVEADAPAGTALALTVPEPKLWSPASPFLYDLKLELRRGAEVLDAVQSYVGMRQVDVAPGADGRPRIRLNGEVVFQVGPLDQGFWPDGLYTPPTDAALRYDLELTKQLGFNMTRKHVKVEPRRWYYWADKLGLLVWQDMPSGNFRSQEGRAQYEVELRKLIETHRNHPCIIMWVPFNEGWGQFDTPRITALVKQLDPTRLVNNASGWTDHQVGDVLDVHTYPAPQAPSDTGQRAGVIGEFGGLGLAIAGHRWEEKHWGYQATQDSADLTAQYEQLLRSVYAQRDSHALCAAVYTQITDVEIECNGLATYDRAVLKVDLPRVAAANRGDFSKAARFEPVVPAADTGAGGVWAYTFEKPADGWYQPNFDDSAWQRGPAGFGTPATPGARLGTPWNTADIWLRRTVELPPGDPTGLRLNIHHDEDAEVYVNGVLAGRFERFQQGYRLVPLSPEARAAVQPGANVVAVHCHQTAGGQYIDVGFTRVVVPQ